MEETRIIIKAINLKLVKEKLQCLEREGVIVNNRGNKIDLEIKDKKLVEELVEELVKKF